MKAAADTRIRVAHLIYSEKVGGSETVAANVCSRLDRHRFDPMLLFFYKSRGSMPQILSRLGVAHDGLNITRSSLVVRPFLVAAHLNRLRIDILHVHHVHLYRRVARGVRLSRVRGVVVTEHAKFSISRSASLQGWSRKTARRANIFTVVSNNLKNYFVEELDIPEQLIRVIYNGIDTERFVPRRGRGKLTDILAPANSGKDIRIMISVGRLAEAKDHLTMLNALKMLRKQRNDFHLVLIGDGELRSTIGRQIRSLELSDNVTVAGSRSDVDDLMPAGDLFVLSSKREGLPMVIMEAMASGLPVVATAVGAVPEIIRDGENGLLVPPGDPRRLAAAINTLLDNRSRAVEMGHAGRRFIVGNHSLEAIAAQYAALYSAI